MENESVFTRVESGLAPVLEELRRREPIFHRQAFGRTVEDFERGIAPEYWEVGASGRRYSGQFILRGLKEYPPVDAEATGWKCSEFGLRGLGADCYLLTYTLDQNGRLTRRATIWQRSGEAWRILYHQGTIVSVEEDDTMPSEAETVHSQSRTL